MQWFPHTVLSFCFNSILKPFIPSSIALLPLMLPLQTVTIMIIVVTCLRVLHFIQPTSGNKMEERGNGQTEEQREAIYRQNINKSSHADAAYE